MNLGAERLGLHLHLTARRLDRRDPEALYYWARAVYSRRGPLVAWRLLERHELPEQAPPHLRADWCALKGGVAAVFRDFELAERCFARAEAIDPGSAWICVERASVLSMQDRYEEALLAASASLERRPWFRPGVQSVAGHLLLLGREQEALELLRGADERLQSAAVAEQRASLEAGLERFSDAARSLERCAELLPLIEDGWARRLAARRSDVFYGLGEKERAVLEARRAGGPFYEEIAKRLEGGDGERRCSLRVPFVRQHHLTCSPASFASLTEFWGRPVDHLALARAITYDGTPGFKERKWAEENGWATREFRVTWEAALGLLDRGLPFTLVTVGAESAHEQVVTGYDARRGVFLIRDPGGPLPSEFLAEPLLQDQEVVGPRGLLALPRDQAGRFDGPLPDEALYDLAYQVDTALQRHDRDAAAAALQRLTAQSPEHVVTIRATRTLAAYDADDSGMQAAAELLHRRFPDATLTLQARLHTLRRSGRREECLELLRAQCEGPESNPAFWREYAEALAADGREQARVLRLLRKGVRLFPTNPGLLLSLANALWRRRELDEALMLYRLAACLDDLSEDLATTYFSAARHLRRTEEALAFLGQRVERLGDRSPQPVQSLFWALQQLDRGDDAFAALEQALARHPRDGDLLCQAADAYARFGDAARAQALLQAARACAPPTALLRTEAALAAYRGDTVGALRLWRDIARDEPLSVDAQREVARVTAATEGPLAALAYAEAAAARLPHHHGLHHVWYEWARDAGQEPAERALQRLVELNPGDPWARRERALLLAARQRLEEAFAELDEAGKLDEHSPSWHAVRGSLLSAAGRLPEAALAFRAALTRDPDFVSALNDLLQLALAPGEGRRELAFVHEQLKARMAYGECLFAYRQHCQSHLSSEETLAALRDLYAARPDLWQTWSCLTDQLIDTNRLDEAVAHAQAAVLEFPLLPGLWLDLARVRGLRGERELERAAVEEAVAVGPRFGSALRRLSELCEEAGQADRARALLEQAVAGAPLDAVNHGYLARLLWALGDHEAATTRLTRALALEPGYDWAWGALFEWCESRQRRDRAIGLARELTARRGGEARSWMVVARVLRRPDDLQERLLALDRATSLEPRLVEAYDLKAELLAGAGRFDEAAAACRPTTFGAALPRELRGRAAWLLAVRGDRGAAIRDMRELLQAEPAYHWGLARLADWCAEEQDWERYLEAAKGLVELAPHHAISLGYRGDARLRTGDRAGGKADLRRALELDSEYVFARRSLVDVCLEDGELDHAQQALQAAAAVPGDDSRRVQWLRLQMKRGHKTDAEALLREWLADPQLDPGWLEPALSELSKHGWQDAVDAAAAQAAAAPTCHPALARAWIAPFAARGDFKACAERLRRLGGRDALLVPALILLLESAGRAQQRDAVERVLKQHRELVERDASVWGTAGYAFVELGDHAQARRWLQRWAKRPGVLPWMLYNLVLALTRSGEWDQAIAVSRAALTLPADHTTNDHVAWLLADQALGFDPRPAEASARRLDGVKLDPRFEFLRTLAVGVLGLRRSLGFAWFQAEVAKAEAVLPGFAREPDLQHAYVKSVWRAARGQRRLSATLWAFFRCWRAERDAPLAALLRLLKERPLEVAAPPPQRVAAPPRRRSSDA